MGSVAGIVENASLRKSVTYPNGRTLTFAWDNIDRLDTITDSGSTLADYDYKGYYLQDRKLNADVLRLTYTDAADLDGYDAFGRTAWMRHYQVSSGDNAVLLAYGYDKASNPLYQEDEVNEDQDELYGYDYLHRLTSLERGALDAQKTAMTTTVFDQAWTLDKLGNWNELDDNGTDDVRQHNAVNEIALPSGGEGYPRTYGGVPRKITWDAAGNLATCETENGSVTYHYAYDYRNRIVLVEYDNGDDVAQYRYDGQNRRIYKKVVDPAKETAYIYDGWQVLEERDKSGAVWQVNRQFVYGGRYIDEPVIFDINADPEGDNGCADVDDTRYLYCQNANWNVMALTDETGVLVEDVPENPYHFQGRRLDNETGLYYFRNRYYHPTLGRFVQRDPIGYADGVSLYECCVGRPVSVCDPSGLKVTVREHEVVVPIPPNYPDSGTSLPTMIREAIEKASGQKGAAGATIPNQMCPQFEPVDGKIVVIQDPDDPTKCLGGGRFYMRYNVVLDVYTYHLAHLENIKSAEIRRFYSQQEERTRRHELARVAVWFTYYGYDWLVLAFGKGDSESKARSVTASELSSEALRMRNAHWQHSSDELREIGVRGLTAPPSGAVSEDNYTRVRLTPDWAMRLFNSTRYSLIRPSK